ncbi:hypothetical protein ACILG0_04080 [Pseudomonadota bacterium AL_CKDN230030165-1A_HGKHYDSX7]
MPLETLSNARAHEPHGISARVSRAGTFAAAIASVLRPRTLLVAGLLAACGAAHATQQPAPSRIYTFQGVVPAKDAAECLVRELPGEYRMKQVAPGHYRVSRVPSPAVTLQEWEVIDAKEGALLKYPATVKDTQTEEIAIVCATPGAG